MISIRNSTSVLFLNLVLIIFIVGKDISDFVVVKTARVVIRRHDQRKNYVKLPQKYYFYLNMLVYLVVSYLNNIYLTTTNEFICQNLVEIKMLIDIHLF